MGHLQPKAPCRTTVAAALDECRREVWTSGEVRGPARCNMLDSVDEAGHEQDEPGSEGISKRPPAGGPLVAARCDEGRSLCSDTVARDTLTRLATLGAWAN